MPYLSLYRKYRPRNFAEIVGQRHVTQTLSNAVKADRIAHAYLFCGPRGTGKTSTARVLAMALNCEKGPTPAPCGECDPCRRIAAGNALDVFELDAASHRRIEDISPLLERVGLVPAEFRSKVYIIDEAHMLTDTSFNAFLKTLEEPPANVVFVLATTEPHQLPPTILSRCQRFDFHRVGLPEIEATIRGIAGKEGIEISDKAITLLVHAADGSVRDAITLLEQAFAYCEQSITPEVVTEILGGIDFDLLADCAEVFIHHDVSAALNLVDRVVAEGKDLRQLVGGMIGHYRNLLVLRVDRRGQEALTLPEEAAGRAAQQAKSVSVEEIVRALDLLAECDRELRFTTQPRLVLELCAVRMCRSAEAAIAVPPVEGHRAEARPVAKPAPAEPEATSQPTPDRPADRPAAMVSEGEEPGALGQIKDRWDEVLANLRKAGQTSIAAFLREAVPAALDEGVLTLAFHREFHYDKMAGDEKRRQLAAAAIARVFGVEVTVRCRLAVPPQESEGAPDPGEPARPEMEGYLSMFPGSEVEE